MKARLTAVPVLLSFFLLLFSSFSLAAPTITSFSPGHGKIGSVVIITGTDFNANAAENTVQFKTA